MYSRVYVEITNICNMSCSFCHGHSREKRRMTEEEFLRVLEQVKPYTKYLYYHLMGEPLTHPLLPRFLRLATCRGFYPTVTTNGTLLRERGKEIIDAGAYKVVVSLHSFEGEAGDKYDEYLASVADFATAAEEAGIIVVLRLWNKDVDGGLNEHTVCRLRELIPGEWAETPRNIRIRGRMFLEMGERFVWPDKDAPIIGESVFCYGMRDHFGILCDGSVVPCCLDSDGAVTLGNVFTDELGDILSSPRAVAISEGFSNRKTVEDLCRRCSYARRFDK